MRKSLRQIYHRALCLLPPKRRIQFHYLRHHRRLPDLCNPQTYTEKIQYQKLYGTEDSASHLADKILVKDFVAQTLGTDWVIPTLYSGSRLPPRDERDWPLPYVVKASHSSGRNIFIRKPEDENWPILEPLIEGWLGSDRFAEYAAEKVYQTLTPKVLVEPFMSDDGDLPKDYKFHVFSGRVEHIHVDTGRETNHRLTNFDRDWNRLPFTIKYPPDEQSIPAPLCLDEMIEAAETLGKPFSYIRVDLYEVNKRPLFGELTFYPSSGLGRVMPREYDLYLGRLWQLPK